MPGARRQIWPIFRPTGRSYFPSGGGAAAVFSCGLPRKGRCGAAEEGTWMPGSRSSTSRGAPGYGNFDIILLFYYFGPFLGS